VPKTYRKSIAINREVAGGVNWGTGVNPYAGTWGAEVIPANSVNPIYDRYGLGAQLAKFRNPAEKFMVLEWEYANSEVACQFPYDTPCRYNTAANYPQWVRNNGNYAFRHGNFQRANFLFVDGHVESLHWQDKINYNSRFGLLNR
jgi:prepilin-type processing-associated H-X9-DG protein